MTQKDDTPITPNQENDIENTPELEKKLKEIQTQKQVEENESENEQITILQEQIQKLQQEKKEFEEIAKKAQYDYLNLKIDFDRFQRQTEENNKNSDRDGLIKTVKKLLPFVEELRKSLDHINQDQQNQFSEGIKMIYDKLLKTLESLNIKPIESIGQTPDSLMHEPISMKPTEDTNLKGKIIEEFERGFYYEKDGEKIVISSSKVIIGG